MLCKGNVVKCDGIFGKWESWGCEKGVSDIVF